MVEIHGNKRIVGVAQNALHRVLGRGFHGRVDFFDRGIARSLKRKVDTGYVWGWDTNGHTVQFSVQLR